MLKLSIILSNRMLINPKRCLKLLADRMDTKENTKNRSVRKDIYFAHMKEVFDDIDRKYNFSYSYFGYVKSTEEDYLGVEYNFTFACHKEDQPCSLSEEKARKTAKETC